ncbi:MAG: hypothetical protein IKP45_07315 [Bacteroidales bacterium]|nr:hypothetical protein [Bacteroidales bacterium]
MQNLKHSSIFPFVFTEQGVSPQSLIDRHIEALKEALGMYVVEEKKSTYRLKK